MAWRGVRDCMRGLALRRSVFVCWRLLGSGQSRRRASGGIKSLIVGRVVISWGGVREALSIRMEAFGTPAERVAKEDASAESNRTQRRETQQCLYALRRLFAYLEPVFIIGVCTQFSDVNIRHRRRWRERKKGTGHIGIN